MNCDIKGLTFLTFWADLLISPPSSTIRGGDGERGGLCVKTHGSEDLEGQKGLAAVKTVVSFGGGASGGTYGFHSFGGGGTESPTGRGGGPRLMLISLSLSDDIHGE
jgi:hypothetical protein